LLVLIVVCKFGAFNLELRADPGCRGIHVAVLSASAMPEDIARAMQAGANDYWTKPIDFGHFLGGLDALARARRH
jgi:CheY-like chemotaxis protein